jgi:hypothetical protein
VSPHKCDPSQKLRRCEGNYHFVGCHFPQLAYLDGHENVVLMCWHYVGSCDALGIRFAGVVYGRFRQHVVGFIYLSYGCDLRV